MESGGHFCAYKAVIVINRQNSFILRLRGLELSEVYNPRSSLLGLVTIGDRTIGYCAFVAGDKMLTAKTGRQLTTFEFHGSCIVRGVSALPGICWQSLHYY